MRRCTQVNSGLEADVFYYKEYNQDNTCSIIFDGTDKILVVRKKTGYKKKCKMTLPQKLDMDQIWKNKIKQNSVIQFSAQNSIHLLHVTINISSV